MIKSVVLTKFCDILVIMFNGLMKTLHLPNAGKLGLLYLYLKVEESSDPGNYRGITIKSCSGKLLL